MSILPEELMKLPLDERAFLALQSAMRKVVEEHARLGMPLHVWSDGKVVEIDAKEDLLRQQASQ